jgi:Cohesin domain/Dockerin type I domain
MNKKKVFLSVIALLVMTIFNVSIYHASAPPTSPYIMVVPSTQTISSFPQGNTNCTVTITTDYSGYDIWGYQIRLTYDTSLLQCLQVNNGNLITVIEDPTAVFLSKINNTIGEVSAGAYFYYTTPPPYTTSGPGTLATVTFTVLRTGTTSLVLQKETKLQGFDFVHNQVYNIIAADQHPNNIGHGTVKATIGDVNVDHTVNAADLTSMSNAYGSTAGPPPSPNWNANCDFHGDSTIEVRDLFHLGKNYGRSW